MKSLFDIGRLRVEVWWRLRGSWYFRYHPNAKGPGTFVLWVSNMRVERRAR